MADFASLCFSNEALKWHSRLPTDVQEDWFKLEAALVDRWSMEEDDSGCVEIQPIQPTLAAAPIQVIKEGFDAAKCGVLRVVIQGYSASGLYLAGNGSDACELTNTIGDALRIRLGRQSEFVIMEVIGAPYHSWVGIHWSRKNPHIGQGSYDYARFSLVDSQDLRSSYGTAKGPFQLAMLDILKDGRVVSQWYKNGNKAMLGGFVTGNQLCIAPDPIAYKKACGREKEATFLFEELD